MKILIVSGGSIEDSFAKNFLKNYTFDRIIAADAGLGACDRLAVIPTDILGDFDSLKNLELREKYRSMGIPVREFPTRKDYTDTHLAILYAQDLFREEENLDPGESGIWILGATGTRFDHTLANVGLLTYLADEGITCKIVDDHNEMEMLKGPVERSYPYREDMKYFSLLPFSREASGIDLEGFSYPLEDAVLRAYESMGVSNEITQEYGTIRIKEGYILIIRARD